ISLYPNLSSLKLFRDRTVWSDIRIFSQCENSFQGRDRCSQSRVSVIALPNQTRFGRIQNTPQAFPEARRRVSRLHARVGKRREDPLASLGSEVPCWAPRAECSKSPPEFPRSTIIPPPPP